MSKERLIEQQRDASESADRLTEAAAQPESGLIHDATIQRFEFTFEIMWKTLKLSPKVPLNELKEKEPGS